MILPLQLNRLLKRFFRHFEGEFLDIYFVNEVLGGASGGPPWNGILSPLWISGKGGRDYEDEDCEQADEVGGGIGSCGAQDAAEENGADGTGDYDEGSIFILRNIHK